MTSHHQPSEGLNRTAVYHPTAGKESACNSGDLGSILRLERSPGEGNGYPLQYSGLENSMDCIVHGVAKSWTRVSDFHFHFSLQLWRSEVLHQGVGGDVLAPEIPGRVLPASLSCWDLQAFPGLWLPLSTQNASVFPWHPPTPACLSHISLCFL